jgi:SAM-dependent methyltransferase
MAGASAPNGTNMALSQTFIRLLAKSHARQAFAGPILTLGRQGIYGSLEDCCDVIRAEGIEPRPLPKGLPYGTNVNAFKSGPTKGYTSDEAMFWSLCGEKVQALDISDYENADYIQDLNQPILPNLENRFGLIVDGGTLEHIFDTAQALRNLKRMVRIGGRIIHLVPMNSWSEHGFYQFSPTLFHDFYTTNGFRMSDCLIVSFSLSDTESLFSRKGRVWRWSPSRPSAPITSKRLLTLYFEAEKVAEVVDHVPQQGETLAASSSQLIAGAATGRLNRLREKALEISPSAGALVLLGKKLLGKDLSSPPWGLTYLGKL